MPAPPRPAAYSLPATMCMAHRKVKRFLCLNRLLIPALLALVFCGLLAIAAREYVLNHYADLMGEEDASLSRSLMQITTPSAMDEDTFDPWAAIRDASQLYCQHVFLLRARLWPELSDHSVCLATHSSLDHLHHVASTLTAWDGPVSLAVFAPDLEFPLAREYVHYLRACFPDIRDQVSFHFVYPANRPARMQATDTGSSQETPDFNPTNGKTNGGRGERSSWNCSQSAHDVLQTLLSRRPSDMLKKWRDKLPYPQNLMRNVARRACSGTYVLCPDVDMVVTMNGLGAQLAEFLDQEEQRACTKCAYVLPVYEVKNGEDPPSDKKALLRLVKAKRARPFHVQVFWHNQGLSRLREWEKHGQGDQFGISHTVENYAFWYEPVYVAKRTVPPYDERFIGFGYTRNTQVFEMATAGWRFLVLNNAFLVHWGFQTLKQRPPWRNTQASNNGRLFANFVREVVVRYDRDPFGMLAKYSRRSAQVQVTSTSKGKNSSSKSYPRGKGNP